MLNCTELIPKYYHEAKYDSLNNILIYWEEKCGITEPLIRFKILYAIKNGTFSENLYDENIFKYLSLYEELINEKNYLEFTHFELGMYWNPFSPLHRYNTYVSESFDDFTRLLAHENTINEQRGTLEYLFSKYYNNDFEYLIDELKREDQFNESDLKQYYLQNVEETLEMAEGHIAFLSGLWVPLGENKLLGNHPELGFMVGTKVNKYLVDLTLLFRFLQSSAKYKTRYKGDLINSDHFLGAYIGLDLGYEIYRNTKYEFDLIGGFGYDGIDVVKSSSKNSDDGKTLHSFNMNAGLGYRYYFSEYSSEHLGLEARINRVDYDNKGGTNLSGNTVSIRILYGLAGNEYKNNKLKKLKSHY